jgi:hypothetical protein
MKLVHRAHDATTSAWGAHWIDMEFGGLLASPNTTADGVHLTSLRRLALLPDYRVLTTVEVGDGKTTSFWHDCWTVAGPLADAYPALFTLRLQHLELTVAARLCSSPLSYCGGGIRTLASPLLWMEWPSLMMVMLDGVHGRMRQTTQLLGSV